MILGLFGDLSGRTVSIVLYLAVSFILIYTE